MTEKTITFNRTEFLKDLAQSIARMDDAEKLGASLAEGEIERLLLVGCGAPNYLFRAINTWIGSEISSAIIDVIHPNTLHLPRYTPDDATAVIFGSHSGTTAETVRGAELLAGRNIPTIAISQHTDSPLASRAKHVLSYGASRQGYFSTLILTLTLVSAFLERKTPGWKLHAALKSSLPNLPKVLADAKESSMEEGIRHAAALQNAESLYVIGNGPMYTTAYVFAACFLMEMQRMHAHPIDSLDFFHGPFELLDEAKATLLLMGEGTFRADAERVQAFCERYTGGCITYDSKTFAMQGIDERIRPIAAPFIVDAALTNVVEQLAILRKHPLDTRRYMGKVDY